MKQMTLPFRPFKFLKRFLPKTLFARSLLILIMPLVLVQGVTTYVFVERHWSWVTKHIAQTLSAQIVTVVDMYEQKNDLYDRSKGRFALGVSIAKDTHITPAQFKAHKADYNWDEAYFDEVLSHYIHRPFRVKMDNDFMYIEVLVDKDLVYLVTDRKRLFAKTTPIFLMWALGTPIIFLIIAALFMRNQVRPIRRLANAAYLFGKRQLIKPFKPQGAYEVRKAGIAFNQMRERIHRQITQRTEMLAGVSHDLRTPLTRMELQLAMMGDSKEVKDLKRDLKEMAKTIDEYIDFARGEEKESARIINLTLLLGEISKTLKNKTTTFYLDLPKSLKLLARKHSIQRCLTNILVNARNHADNIWISGDLAEDDICIVIDDDGPGIPDSEKPHVFKPFYRVESSRNRETGGERLRACDRL